MTARPLHSSRFACIEAGRGVAAILVVIYHAVRLMDHRFSGDDRLGELTGNFNAGVDFFFTLSGFIIAWTHWNDLGQPSRIGAYARKRFLRIYPAYWGIVIPLILLYLAFPHAGKPEQHDPLNIVLSLVLAPNPQQPVLGVAWTLTYEIFFYVLFAGLIASGRRALLVMPVWAAAIMVAAVHPPTDWLVDFALNPYNLDFIIGVGAAVLLRRYTIPYAAILAWAGLALFAFLLIGAPLIQETRLLPQIGFGGASALFVLGTVETERERALALPRLFGILGAASYAIYLIHPVALSFTALAMAHFHVLFSANLAALSGIVIGVLSGMAYRRFVDTPLTRLCTGLIPARGAQPRTGPLPADMTIRSALNVHAAAGTTGTRVDEGSKK